jgi:D-alanyl-D-alanine carboxypeptidase (penicillin-binding protein 5/6)
MDHYSTAHDLAVLSNEVIKNNLVNELVVRESAQITAIGGAVSYKLENKNALLGRYQGALGLKTGYTPKAGKCLIAYAVRDGKHVLLVMLNAPNRWWDAVDILDLAFAQARHAP